LLIGDLRAVSGRLSKKQTGEGVNRMERKKKRDQKKNEEDENRYIHLN